MRKMKDPSRLDYMDSLSWGKLQSIFTKIMEDSVVKTGFASAGFAVHWLFGEKRLEALVVVSVLIVLDTVTGAMKAFKAHKISSQGFFRFALKCMVYFILMATGALVDKVMPIPFASIIMTVFLACTEAISIMENMAAIGFAVPTVLVRRLKALRDDPESVAKAQPLTGQPEPSFHGSIHN